MVTQAEKEFWDEVDRQLIADGYPIHIPLPITDFTPYENRTLIKVEGKPLSEIIVEDRR